MASLYKEQDTWVIRFADGNGKRKSIRFGKMPKKAAQTILSHVETIISYRLAGQSSFPPETSAWIGNLPDDTLTKLAKAGLISFQRHTLGELWETFRKQKKGVKKSTLDVYDYTEHRLFAYFDREVYLHKLLPEHFEKWKEFLLTEYSSPRTKKPLVKATVAGAITKVKAVINWAIEIKWISKEQNPLESVSRGSFMNKDKDREVTMEEYYRLLEACPCQDWRVIFALARIGGLRPGEILLLRWADVDWKRARFCVTSTKTEHHEGKGKRDVPLFPELRVELARLFEDKSSDGKEFVINRYNNREQSLTSLCAKIAHRAGIEEFPRPFDNMRASRSTEIYNEFGAFLESKWIGHSHKIAMKCYLQVREVDFERAVSNKMGQRNAPNCASEISVGQIPGQHTPASSCRELPENKKSLQIAGSDKSVQLCATAKFAEKRTRTSTSSY